MDITKMTIVELGNMLYEMSQELDNIQRGMIKVTQERNKKKLEESKKLEEDKKKEGKEV